MDQKERASILALSDVEIERMWQLALHEEGVLNQRSGLFLVANAMLLIFTVEASIQFSEWVMLIAACSGISMSIIWVIINERQVDEMKRAARIVRVRSAGFEIYDASTGTGFKRGLRKYGTGLFAIGVPLLVFVIWCALLLDIILGIGW
ncbi:MAG: hypothetical protein JKY46_11235 [Robiginitomaculum sp.]|nr:hypothetical protein [Robiginitomaculum sp.]